MKKILCSATTGTIMKTIPADEVIAASENLHTLNSIMRDSVKRSGVLDEEEIEWDEDETERLADDPNQMYVCYSFYCSPCNYAKAVWEITEVEVK